MATIEASHQCAVCDEPASKRCVQCKLIWYCSKEHQVSHWKGHKKQCKMMAADQAQAESHEIHKREFDRIRKKYGLDNPVKAEKIADLLANTNANEGVSAPEFANLFGMTVEEAVVFLEWIKVGIKFKEETLDTAKKAGLTNSKEN